MSHLENKQQYIVFPK